MKDLLETYIPIGKENAVHQEYLASELGVTSATVKSMICEARKKGVVICSGTQGYWLPKDDDEVKEFLLLMRKQALSRLDIIKNMNTLFGQIDFFETDIKQ